MRVISPAQCLLTWGCLVLFRMSADPPRFKALVQESLQQLQPAACVKETFKPVLAPYVSFPKMPILACYSCKARKAPKCQGNFQAPTDHLTLAVDY